MGGAAAIIKGKVANRLLQTRPVKRGLIGRLLKKDKFVKPKEIELGDGRFMTEVPSDDFAHLANEFVEKWGQVYI
ncbi:MAG: hypothetical protein ABIK92_14720 [Pseudomonadota bacterium]